MLTKNTLELSECLNFNYIRNNSGEMNKNNPDLKDEESDNRF